MSQRVEASAGYVLHSRPYRETSLLVDFLTLEQGRISAVARGARRPRARLRSTLQPFQTLQLGWQGRQELKTLGTVEAVEISPPLSGRALLCGLYVNELLQRLLQPGEPCPRLFLYYRYVLNELLEGRDLEGALRTFERQLLAVAATVMQAVMGCSRRLPVLRATLGNICERWPRTVMRMAPSDVRPNA